MLKAKEQLIALHTEPEYIKIIREKFTKDGMEQFSGRKIDMIKEYRSLMGCGLKEGKEAIEKYFDF
jgi:ribosomal protein L7/L12